MADGPNLQDTLENILGSENVYFQPPESLKLSYPAIVYELARFDTRFANDAMYKLMDCYTVTLIDKNPKSEFIKKLLTLPYCSFDRHFKSDNLNHYVYTLYF